VPDDDLAHPRLHQPFDALARYGTPLASRLVSLESPALVVGAMRQTDLSELDVGPIAEPLEILSRSLQREAKLHALGRVAARQLLRGFLATRGRLADLARRRPDVVGAPVEPPIIVMGMPRTGTTFLQRLLARDPGLRHLPYWEAQSPLPTGPADDRDAPTEDRIAAAERAIGVLDRAAPQMKAMHEVDAHEADEELWLLAVGFGSMLFEAQWNVPAYAEWYDAADLHGAYGTLRDLMAVLQWYRPAERWLLKSPQHLERLVEITDVFPGATIVQTHRDPVSVVPSTASLISYSRRMGTFEVTPTTVGRYWAWRIERLLTRSIEQRAATGARVVDVRFHDLLADPMGVVEEVYRVAGRGLTDEARHAMERYLVERPKGHFGAHAYSPEDFGLDPGELRRRFADYCDRFDVRPDN
jgi:hypothetical protein